MKLTTVFLQTCINLGSDQRKTRIANAYFSLFMAVGNVLGFATGSYSGCISAAQELPLSSSSRSVISEDERPEPSHNAEEAFLWELFGTFRYLSWPVWIILIVTALTWIGWFPFLLFDTDWMGREIYKGKPNEGQNYHIGVRMGALGLMLNSIVLGLTSVVLEKLCRKWGSGLVWGTSNVLMSLGLITMLIISLVVKNMHFHNGDLPPYGVVIAALAVFAVLGVPLSVTYSIPYAMVSTRIESLGLGQGLSMGVLNLAIVIPQVLVSLGSGPWDQLFGGGNSPSFAVGAVAAFTSGLVAILALSRTYTPKPRPLV
uniref:Sucrose transport protein SUC4-like n=1 Tax=Nelumbo nucifera TaxID=4432 RepID=A0A822Z5J9_NELNU|nr:TPA_asm: hypothetical protein HUJ06_014675 [Nelumbo nucifera]